VIGEDDRHVGMIQDAPEGSFKIIAVKKNINERTVD
jgi:hypothetical protein